MEICSDKMLSIYNLTQEHYQELEKNIEHCDNIADIKSKIKDEGVTEIKAFLMFAFSNTLLFDAKVILPLKNVYLPNKILHLCNRQTKEYEYEPNKGGVGD